MKEFVPRCLVCFLLFGLGAWAGSLVARPPGAGETALSDVVPRQDIQQPDPRLTPAEVVQLQVDALQRFQHDQDAIAQCFVLASPANRAITGPLNRFAAMVLGSAYQALVTGTSSLVGKAVVRDEQATVLVTVVDSRHQASVYRFFLSKQSDPPLQGCWMTDAVYPPQEMKRAVPASSPEPAA